MFRMFKRPIISELEKPMQKDYRARRDAVASERNIGIVLALIVVVGLAAAAFVIGWNL